MKKTYKVVAGLVAVLLLAAVIYVVLPLFAKDSIQLVEIDPVLQDHDEQTWISFAEDSGLILRGQDGKIQSVYLVWKDLPGQWTLIADGKKITCGEHGFLHEYVKLEKPADKVIIQAQTDLCDVYAFEENATIPDWVQIWQDPWEHADMLVMPTHADDEHIFFGAMMPYYAAERGLKVQVAYFTHHWHQYPREHELLNGLWTVGIRAYPIISEFKDEYADTIPEAEAMYPLDDALAYQVGLLRRFKPSVVVTHDLNGEYGHGVHKYNAYCMTQAVALAADATAYPETAEQYGVWDTPKLYLHLYPENQIIMDWYKPMDAFDGRNGFDVAAEGYAKHVSQQAGGFIIYGKGTEYDSRKFGLYRSTVGPDVVGGDVFENITKFY